MKPSQHSKNAGWIVADKKYLPKYSPYVAEWEEWARKQTFYALFDECLIGWEGAASKYGKELTALRQRVAELEKENDQLHRLESEHYADLTQELQDLRAFKAAVEAAPTVRPDWYQCPTTENWFEHQADAELLAGFVDPLQVGQEIELNVCWSGEQKFRVTKIEDDESGDVELELIESSRHLFTRQTPAGMTFDQIRDGIANAVGGWPNLTYWPHDIAKLIRQIGPTPTTAPVTAKEGE